MARVSDPRDSRATFVLMWALWSAGKSEQFDELVTAEEWVPRDRQCGLTLAEIRIQQSRFKEAISLCRALIEADPKDSDAHLALSECLLTVVQANRVRLPFRLRPSLPTSHHHADRLQVASPGLLNEQVAVLQQSTTPLARRYRPNGRVRKPDPQTLSIGVSHTYTRQVVSAVGLASPAPIDASLHRSPESSHLPVRWDVAQPRDAGGSVGGVGAEVADHRGESVKRNEATTWPSSRTWT